MTGFKTGVLLLLSILLTGCIGVATTGAQAVYDRHNFQNNFTNHEITWHIQNVINRNPDFSKSDIGVASFHFEVLLVGTASSEFLRLKAAHIAAFTPSVEHVYNFITVGPPIKTSVAAYDTWLTTKIKSKIIAKAKMDPAAVKVITENHVVYLIGFVTPLQAKLSVDTASGTDGVKKVVKIFKYVTISDKPPPEQKNEPTIAAD